MNPEVLMRSWPRDKIVETVGFSVWGDRVSGIGFRVQEFSWEGGNGYSVYDPPEEAIPVTSPLTQ